MESSSSGMFVFWNKPQFELSTKLPMIGWGGAFLTFQSLIDHPFTGTSLTEDTASMPVVDRCEEDCSDSGKSCGSSGSSLLLHTSRLLHASFWLSLLVMSFCHMTVLRLNKMMKRLKVSSVTLPLSFESQWRGDLTIEVFHWGLKNISGFTEPGMLPASVSWGQLLLEGLMSTLLSHWTCCRFCYWQ